MDVVVSSSDNQDDALATAGFFKDLLSEQFGGEFKVDSALRILEAFRADLYRENDRIILEKLAKVFKSESESLNFLHLASSYLQIQPPATQVDENASPVLRDNRRMIT